MTELKRRTVLSTENGIKYLYELWMTKMPKAPAQYFREVIQIGDDGWIWIGSGTATRNHNEIHEVCQVV